ncbi:multiple sugar transport system substrate-binding protein [Paenibacillus sp. UNCCL117]|uniref:ABC transporter substrate-binding protein n=1 Tax=unclassified Paenibacillus TaxID=185978 RepID=UPI00089093C8|nr:MULTISPECIES: sugar ABC transporter substrate-binding protein [unclassified Paenibacillus]SDE49152.1 carbohydrate ABC transporter substrate-binding protein, CUT1 family [Paenibacillus sp. cl123]SFW66820.1 multiple sugar transport system substrate-binding protein [Paenibacillus sp. UNCCL117]
MLKMNKKSRFHPAAFMAVMLIFLIAVAGCSGGSGASTKNPADPPAGNTGSSGSSASNTPKTKQKVQVMSWWDFTTSEPLKQLKAKFEEMNPDLELEYMQIGTGYADKVLAMVAGGGALPDVMMLAMDKVPVFADKGAILSLEKYVTKEYTSGLYPVVSDALTFNGKPYAVARDITSKVMFLNKKVFDEAKVPYPGADWTMEDFRNTAKQLTKKDAAWGFYFPKNADGYTHFLYAMGGGLVTQDGKSLLAKKESGDALQFLQDMIVKDQSVMSETQAQQFGKTDMAVFIAGKAGMIAGGLSYTASFKQANVEYLVRPLPKKDKTTSTSFVNSWVIPKGAKNPDLSWRVLQFLSSKEAQQIALDTAMGLPASKSVDTTAFLKQHPDNKYFIESLGYSVPFPTPVYGADFNAEVQKQFDLMWLGQKSVADSVAAVEKAAPNVLAGKK